MLGPMGGPPFTASLQCRSRGPIVADAIFHNREEVTVRPVYRDPIHDFSFFMFDPAELHFMALGEIPLAPEAAAVGLDIRVVGNDSGEKVGGGEGRKGAGKPWSHSP